MERRRFPPLAVAEQFLRALYGCDVAGQHEQSREIYGAFVKRVRQGAYMGDPPLDLSLRLLTANAIAGNSTDNISDLVSVASIFGRAYLALMAGNKEALSDAIDEIASEIEVAEARDLMSDTQDGWHYILVKRLRDKLARLKD
jgi:hypothetical protein